MPNLEHFSPRECCGGGARSRRYAATPASEPVSKRRLLHRKFDVVEKVFFVLLWFRHGSFPHDASQVGFACSRLSK